MEINNRNDFGKLAEVHKLTGLGAEIGVQYGFFSQKITEHYTGRMLCVDIWPDEQIYKEAIKNLAFTGRHSMCKLPSFTACKLVPDESLDFVYIDGDHHYGAVLGDILSWFPKVRKGGIVAGHDYVKYLDMKVIEAVDDFCKQSGYKIKLTTEDEKFDNTCFSTWYFIK